ncbi:hypothetical protein FAI40_03515 [Acetobacteraceae bacterium]|nr:hypothetical protein FAI40_03515 [Acetobacteraceae bacterium]
MTETYAQKKVVPVEKNYDAVSQHADGAAPTDEKDFGIRGAEEEAVLASQDPATKIPPRPLDR